jgi:CSLREA domain-containing protein
MRTRRAWIRLAAAFSGLTLAATGALVVVATTPAHAVAPIVVDTTADEFPGVPGDCSDVTPNNCSLRDAVAAANAAAGADLIQFSVATPATFTVATGAFAVNSGPLTIDGPTTGAADIVIDLNGITSAFDTFGSGTFTVQDLTIREGAITGLPGGAISSDGDVVATNVAFINNTTANASGGAISTTAAVTVTDSNFTGNQVRLGPGNGGAISAGGAVGIYGASVFTNNDTTNGTGGAVDATGQTVTISGGADFADNDAPGGGGAGGCVNAGPITVNNGNSFFENNTAENVGGCLRGSTVQVDGATFTSNDSTTNRGGAINSATSTTVTGSTFGGPLPADGNTASVGGGAIGVIDTSTISVSGSTFENNSGGGTEGGGAIDMSNTSASALTVKTSTFADNVTTSSGTGGAISALKGILDISDSTFDSNSSVSNGGAIAARTDTIGSITNSTFDANAITAGSGDAVSVANGGGTVELNHVTVTNSQGPGAAVEQTSGTLKLTHSVFADNTAVSGNNCGGAIDDGGYNIETTAGNGGTCPTGGTNESDTSAIMLDALANNGGPTATKRPQAGSPVLNKIPSVDCSLTTDQRGLGRPVSGSCEIGAVEVQLSHLTGTVKDLVPPKGTGIAHPLPAKKGIAVCDNGMPLCSTPQLFPVMGGTYNAALAANQYEVAAYFCKDNTGCTSGGPAVVRGPNTHRTLAIEQTINNANFNIGFRPDVSAKKSNAVLYTGANAYSTNIFSPPNVKANVGANGSVTFNIKIDNDGNLKEMINLKAQVSSSSQFTVTFRQGPFTLSNMTTSGRTFTLSPGQSSAITVTIKAKSTAPINSNKSVLLTAKSLGQSTGAKKDIVLVKATRV